ncbi:MAG: hypothetical protein IPK82_23385 [Polyangiaceae bacterium]|nr:hypothetical protein [Polyangiaceae bacterium]
MNAPHPEPSADRLALALSLLSATHPLHALHHRMSLRRLNSGSLPTTLS